MSQGLLTSRESKNKLMKLSIVDPSPQNILKFKNFRNLYNKLIRAAKKMYYVSELKANANNLKKNLVTTQ